MQAGKTRKIPERRCLGCGESFPKKELLRIVRTSDGNVELDFTGKKSGRGAYTCKKLSCFKKARKAKRFESNLETVIPEQVYLALETELGAYEQQTKI
ncbi:MAG: YlxR family protein [Ruminococcaceae bacterium]|nr:YlxR family protein [Oscillospiraceae bacterium]